MAGRGGPPTPGGAATGGASQPSVGTVLRKLFGRLRRDARFFVGRRPVLAAITAVISALLLLTLFGYRALGGGGAAGTAHGVIRFAPRGDVAATCVCVDGVSSLGRWERSLVSSDVVFRGRPVVPPPPDLPGDQVELTVEQLYRGPERLVEHPLRLRRADVHGCGAAATAGAAPGEPWLVISGVATGVAGRPEGELSVAACGAVLLAPWRSLPEDALRVVAEEGDHGDAWWRNRRQWHPTSRSPAVARSPVVGGGGASGAGASGARARVPAAAAAVEEWWLQEGVTVVAACQDRSDALVEALSSWLRVVGVDEVVLLDWSSSRPIAGHLAEAAPELMADPRLLLARVAGQRRGWVLSRAYNIAARLSSRGTLLKVDCDTVLGAGFVAAHTLTGRDFFAGDWRSLAAPTADERLHMNGMLMVRRADFAYINGYDERIVTYGWDDSDIVTRLSAFRTPRAMDYRQARHVSHAASQRTDRQGAHTLLPPDNPLAAAVEIQRNRLLLKPPRLAPWGASSRGVVYNVRSVVLATPRGANATTTAEGTPSPHGGNHQASPGKLYYLLRVANEVLSAADLVSEADGVDASKRAIRIILKNRRGVPAYHKDLPLDFFLGLAARYASPSVAESAFARVDVIPGGGSGGGASGDGVGPAIAAEPASGCAARLLTLATLRAATSPPLPSFFAGTGASVGAGGHGLHGTGRGRVASAALGRLSASFRHRRDGGAAGLASRSGQGGGGVAAAGGGSLVAPPPGAAGWHARMLWRHPDAGCGCRFSGLFAPIDTELFETAGDAIPAGAGTDSPPAVMGAADTIGPTAPAATSSRTSRTRVVSASLREALASTTSALANGTVGTHFGAMVSTAVITCGVDIPAGAPWGDDDAAYVAAIRHQLRSLVPVAALRSAVIAGALTRAGTADATALDEADAAAASPEEQLTLDVWSRTRGGIQSSQDGRISRGLRAAVASVRAGREAAAVAALMAGCPRQDHSPAGGPPYGELFEQLPELAVIVAALQLSGSRCLALPR
ncbi:hypothetical protein MMPV_000955 [Pyropia vietnamensis]